MADTTKLQDLVGKLPTDLQPYAPVLIQAIAAGAQQEIQAAINLYLKGDWKPAYELAAKYMTWQQMCDEIKRIGATITAENQANASFEAFKESLANAIVSTLFALGLAALGL